MDLSTLIKKGRVEPVLEDRGEFQMVVGYRRPAKSRKHGSWTLREPRPWQVPHAILRKTKGAELVCEARKREALLADKYERAAPGQVFAAAKCYADLAVKLEAGAPFDATAAEVAKAWPWDSSLWTPVADVAALFAKAGGMFWIDAEERKAFGDTGETFVKACYAADVCAKEIDRVLAKQAKETA